jgi:hypothetical protein
VIELLLASARRFYPSDHPTENTVTLLAFAAGFLGATALYAAYPHLAIMVANAAESLWLKLKGLLPKAKA